MRELGLLHARLQQWDDALPWLQRAVQTAPGSVVDRCALVETLVARDEALGTPPAGLPDDVAGHLGAAFHLHPAHPRVAALLERLGPRFGTDLAAHFRTQPVATQFQ